MFMSGLFRRYNVVLKKRPILTQTATATSLAGLGDLIVQMSSEKAFNTTKFLGFTAYAGAYSGPLMHFWFGFLARRFHSFPKMKGLLYKQIVHHGFANPFMYAPSFYLAQGVWLQKSYDETLTTLKKNYFSLLQTTWVVWMPLTGVQFLFVPVQYQVLFASSCVFFWNVFMASL
jgi:hypothetical protein